MSIAGERTRDNILDTALELFAQKGFAAVSMSDFCRECGLSRGGLYRHFSSTAQIFEAMLMRDRDDWSGRMEQAFSENVPAPQMLEYYMECMYEGIISGDGRLSLAAYEYVRTVPENSGFARKRCAAAVDMFASLLRYGCGRGEFRPCDVDILAERCVIFMDGLRIAAACVPFSSETVKRQLDGLAASIIKE